MNILPVTSSLHNLVTDCLYISSNYNKGSNQSKNVTEILSRANIILSDNQCYCVTCARFVSNNTELQGITCVAHNSMVSNIINELNNTSVLICMYIYHIS